MYQANGGSSVTVSAHSGHKQHKQKQIHLICPQSHFQTFSREVIHKVYTKYTLTLTTDYVFNDTFGPQEDIIAISHQLSNGVHIPEILQQPTLFITICKNNNNNLFPNQ